ncbi:MULTISPECIES: addiction module toxin RelE [unclassified Achromobacter]|uniref:addiction module toxin RelE n=1 Tax=unclassified Achromobacter TaxID=2626865 RepID=UPI001CE195D0|nr:MULTISPECIES: addiction module toxin RelE [unclassified Achromobacter]
MKALFIELPAFLRYRSDYLDDDGFRGLQETMMQNPDAGDVLEGAGGLQASCATAIRAEEKASAAACG